MIRRASYTPSTSGVVSAQEPLIVVEESGTLEEEDEEEVRPPSPTKGGPDSPSLNPFLLSPYRDMRKRSLPTPQCTSGITASQVRRLSEQGGEGKGPSPMEAAFLATLTQAPVPIAGGRRHSVVTISRAPPPSVLFGRNRRESIAAFPGRLPRRDSSSSMTGSNFNLQLDIMDDIAEIKAARKVRLKMWQNDNKEKVCEVQPVEGGSSSRYHQQSAPGPSRRFSDVTGIGIPGPSVPQKRRASEMPQVRRVSTPPPSSGKGIVCSNTDLISIMSSLTSSAQEINSLTSGKNENVKPSTLDQKRSRLKGSRSNSFDVSLLPESKGQSLDKVGTQATNWFIRRHQPMATKKCLTDKSNEGNNKGKTGMIVTFADDKLKTILAEKKRTSADNEGKENVDKSPAPEKVVWDKPTGSVVDAQVLGSAIEVFLTQRGVDQTVPPSASSSSSSSSQTPAASIAPTQAAKEQAQPVTPNKSAKTSWFGTSSKSKSSTEGEEQAACDNSICSTLKDLFVK